jgi:response regulator of citrate/malate metabolism
MTDDQLDDNVEFTKRICELIIDRTGIGIIWTAMNQEKGVKILKHEKPYINLLDIHLPGKNGIE